MDERKIVELDISFVGRGMLQVKTSPEDIEVVLRTKERLPFTTRLIAEFTRERASIETSKGTVAETEVAKAETNSLIKGDRGHDCFLLWLPLTIRAMIWELVFQASEGYLFAEIYPAFSSLSLLQVSRLINFEASIAFAQALVSRIVVLVFFPEHCYLKQPLPILAKLGDRILREIRLPLGDREDPLRAMKRSLDFIHLFKVLQARRPIMTFKLTIHIDNFWKLPQIGFDEDYLACAVTGGAFAFIKTIRIIAVSSHVNLDRLQECLRVRSQQQ